MSPEMQQALESTCVHALVEPSARRVTSTTLVPSSSITMSAHDGEGAAATSAAIAANAMMRLIFISSPPRFFDSGVQKIP